MLMRVIVRDIIRIFKFSCMAEIEWQQTTFKVVFW